jgi:hypothetical protein
LLSASRLAYFRPDSGPGFGPMRDLFWLGITSHHSNRSW